MEKSRWKPSEEKREVMEVVWMQIKGAWEKLKVETTTQNEYIRKIPQEMSDRCYLWNIYYQNLWINYQEIDVSILNVSFVSL